MNLLADAIRWILDPAQWQGHGALQVLLLQHLSLTALALVVASIIAVQQL